MSDDPIADAIDANINRPTSFSADGQATTNRSLAELEAIRKSRAADAAAQSASGGIRRLRQKFPGASGVH